MRRVTNFSTIQQEVLVEGGGGEREKFKCKVEVLLVRDMFDKMERKTPNPRGLQGPVVPLS